MRTQLRWRKQPLAGAVTLANGVFGSQSFDKTKAPYAPDRIWAWTTGDADVLWTWNNTAAATPGAEPTPAAVGNALKVAGYRPFIARVPQIIEVAEGATFFNAIQSSGADVTLRFECGTAALPSD